MRFVLIALGHRQPVWVDTAFTEYAKRLPRDARLDLIELKPEPRADNAGPGAIDRLLAREADRIRAAVPPQARVVALDERGDAPTTRALAQRVVRWQTDARDVALVIGSADGLDPGFVRDADERLSLSPLTLPHGLARVLLAEQLYRAWSLARGHPYHRD
ncbi:MAG: 23S rRNA (pseudouridine(1915)-N(3))-methyltransferase RlmH [Burkholderiales bacterium]|nr:23S rRNA (pseudouridine(1915)-N(3))-methyltransferase RlmH [Burkholderiales bacterium]